MTHLMTNIIFNLFGLLSCRYVKLGESPTSAGVRTIQEQTKIVIPSIYHFSSSLIGVYNDPVRDVSEEFRSTITIAQAMEYIPSEMTTSDASGIPSFPNNRRQLLTIPLDEVGLTYQKMDFETDHFAYEVLIDLQAQLNITATRRILQESQNTVASSTCS